MAKVSADLKQALEKLPQADLLKIIVRFASAYEEMNEILEYEICRSDSEEDLFDDACADIAGEFGFYHGRIIQKELAQSISKSIAIINRFKKIVKKPYLETKLIRHLLEIVFESHTKDLGTCWTVFDSKVITTTKRFFTLVFKLHEDYRYEFIDPFNKFLKILKKECSDCDSVYALPSDYLEYEKMKSALSF